MENKPLVSIYTCVYNMADKIHRVFESVQKLTYSNIEHIIINDGSTDDLDEKINDYLNLSLPYKVVYVKKENGGKHTALNIAWEKAKGEFMIQLDADDELLPHSIEFLVEQYYKIPEDRRNDYWCVHGRYKTQHGKFVGDTYPDNINALSFEDAQITASKVSGDKLGLQKSSVLKNYRFPEPLGVKMVSEGIIWGQINRVYRTFYTNEIVGIYYVGEGGNLTSRKRSEFFFSNWCYSSYQNIKLSNMQGFTNNLKLYLQYAMTYSLSPKFYRKNNSYLKELGSKKVLLAAIYPLGFFVGILYKFKYKMLKTDSNW